MFAFKQFTIQQDRTAMKVCTDACVLGAYADVGRGGRILDIGTGTGLLALMAAQRNPMASIDAVEMDDSAFTQATENVSRSPFGDRVRVIHQRIQDVGAASIYDRILTNPPFYSHHLRSPDEAVNRALHADELPFHELMAAVVRLLKPDGQWWVLLPPYEAGKLTELVSEKNLFPFERLFLRHHARKPIFRAITGFAFGEKPLTEQTLDIFQLSEPTPFRTGGSGGAYTSEFGALLRDFYLKF